MKILFLTPYPSGQAPSQRFRFEQYLPMLRAQGHEVSIQSFLDDKAWRILYKAGHTFPKILGILRGFTRRIMMLTKAGKYDRIFIHREAAPLGPPVFEWFLSQVLNKKLIYDFDDAIWLANTSENNQLAARFKWHHKLENICRWSSKISAGNDYLADYARQYNTQVVYNPTTIDTENLHNQVKDQHTEKLVIGWTGTHSTMGYLNELLPVLQKLEEKYDFELSIISNQKPDLPLKSLRYKAWNKATEKEDLLRFNVGLMPLTDDKWAKGKCGFKALQYMALGIPPVVSPVGVNTRIVKPGINGFLCRTPEEWEKALSMLLNDHQLRIKIGKASRQEILENYSVLSNTQNFLSLFS